MSAEKVLQIALAEVGYLEKATNSRLDSKTANAGRNNYTKYGEWYGLNGQPWCDMFVSWCAYKAGELEAVGKYAYVPSHQNFFDKKGLYFSKGSKTPIPGDIVIFKNESHIGFVQYVSQGYVHTIEGNTSGGSTLVDNGGGVHKKSYPLNSSYIQGYCRPAYSVKTVTVPDKEDFEIVKTYKNGSTPETVYADTSKKTKIGKLNAYETCECLGKVDNMYIVRYKIDDTSHYKVGVVSYSGGVK